MSWENIPEDKDPTLHPDNGLEQSDPPEDSGSHMIDREEKFPEAPDDFDLDSTDPGFKPASELGEIVRMDEEEPEKPDDMEPSDAFLETEAGTEVVLTDPEPITERAEEKPSGEFQVERVLVEPPEHVSEERPPVQRDDGQVGKVIPDVIPRKSSAKDLEFKLLSVTPGTSKGEIEMFPVPGDQRSMPLRIFAAQSIYGKLLAHAEEGLGEKPDDSAWEVKGVLIGSALIDVYPTIVINDILELPSSDDDVNDQCSFGAVEDEIIRRRLAKLPRGLTVVAYYHSHPDHPIFLSDFDVAMHNRRCTSPWQLAVVVQPRDRQIGFFEKKHRDNRPLSAFVHAQKPSLKVDINEQGKAVSPENPILDAVPVDGATNNATPSLSSDFPPVAQLETPAVLQTAQRKLITDVKQPRSSRLFYLLLILAALIVVTAVSWFMFPGGFDSGGDTTVQKRAVQNGQGNGIVSLETDTPTPESRLAAGQLALSVFPVAAQVFVDGNKWSLTTSDNRISAGEHDIEVSAKGYENSELTVMVQSGQTLEKTIQLIKVKKDEPVVPKTGTIRLNCSELDFEVVWDDKPARLRGKNKDRITGVSKGLHNLVIRKEGFEDYTEAVRVPSEDGAWTQTIQVEMSLSATPTMTPAPAFNLELNSNPVGAFIIFDGEKQNGQTPMTIKKIPLGNHELIFRKSGFEEYRYEKEFIAEGNETLAVNLIPLPTATPDPQSITIAWQKKPSNPHERKEYLDASISVTTGIPAEDLDVNQIIVKDGQSNRSGLDPAETKTLAGNMKRYTYPLHIRTRRIKQEAFELSIEVINKKQPKQRVVSDRFLIKLVGP